MSSFIANTKIQLATVETTDEHGDPVEGGFAAGTEEDPIEWYPASIIERRKDVFDPTTGQRRTVRFATGRVRLTVPVADGDRIKTNRGKVYIVDEVTGGDKNLAGFTDVTLDLRITSGE